MDRKTFDQQFEPLRNKWGFVSDLRGDSGHNYLFHGFYVALKIKYGFWDEAEKETERSLFRSLLHPEYPGIILAQPYGTGWGNLFSHDVMKAALWLGKVLDIPYAANYLQHMRDHNWMYNPRDPNTFHKSGTLWRFPSMTAQAMIIAGEDPPPYLMAWLLGELIYGALRGKSRVEAVTLPYFICKSVEDYGPITKLCVNYWRKKKMEIGGLPAAFLQYGWTGHPYIEHFKDMK